MQLFPIPVTFMCGYILLSGEGRTSRNLRLNHYINRDILQFQVARSSSLAGVPHAIYYNTLQGKIE